MKVLVTGGAGFIGSHTVKILCDAGHEVIVFDNLSKGHKKTVNCSFVLGSLSDENLLDKTFKEYKIEAVIHFAGFIEAGESMKEPLKFFNNNVVEGLSLLNVMIKNNIKKIIFSSSAAVYKHKESSLIEDDEKQPENFYGETKLMFETILKWYGLIYQLKSISLRYFNAAGAAFGLGENHYPETHLIPLILQTALGQRDHIKIFGTDYNTKDGTCVRDYIHVLDLAKAHLLALERINNIESFSEAYNVGTSQGYSVKEIIGMAKEITGKDFLVLESPRREGDPPILVANSEKIKKELSWYPEYDIKDIIKSAWGWHKNNLQS